MAYRIVAKPLDGSAEASWAVTWKIVGHDSSLGKRSFQSADMVFEQSSVPQDFAFRSTGLRLFLEAADAGKSVEIQPAELGNPKSFDFLLETLEATVATQPKEPKAVKLVRPCGSGNIIQADIVPKRMQDIEYIGSIAALSLPLQAFSEDEWTPSTGFAALFKTSAGAIRLKGYPPNTQSIDAALNVLECDLDNRLPTRLVVHGLRRKTVVFVEGQNLRPHRGGYAAQFYGAAESLGIDVVVLGEEGHWLQSGDEYGHWRKAFIPLEFGHDDQFPSRIAAAVRKYDGPIDGILTIFDSYQVPVSQAATELGLLTEPTSAYKVIGNKYETSVFEGRKSFKVSTHDEAMAIARGEDLAWPIIVKPCRGFASELVMKLDSIQELESAAHNFYSSARHGTDFVMEPYCDGPEVDINFVIYDGEVLFWEIGDEYPKSAEDGSNSFHELDCCSPSELPKAEQNVLHDSIVASLKNLGFRNGLYHCEARVGDSTVEWRHTESGAQILAPREKERSRPPSSFLIEVNPRTPGINSTDVIETTWGVDYFSVLLAIRARESQRVHALTQPYRKGPQYYADMVFVSAAFDESKNGVWESDEVTEELVQRRPDLAQHISKHLTYLRKGDKVPHPSTGINTFVAYLNLFSRKSRQHVLDIAAEVRKELRIEWS